MMMIVMIIVIIALILVVMIVVIVVIVITLMIMTLGRGDLRVCPLGGALQGPMNPLFLIEGVSPRGPRRDKH